MADVYATIALKLIKKNSLNYSIFLENRGKEIEKLVDTGAMAF